MKKLKKPISILTSITTVLWMTGMATLIPVSVGAAVVNGDLIRNPDAEGLASLDIYIVKLIGDKEFKRLILSPHVFESYEHFGWDDVQDVDQAIMDQYTTSDLARPDGQDKVYRLYAAEGTDTGTKYWLNMTAVTFDGTFDSESIYTINDTDSVGYTSGTNVSDPDATFPPEGDGPPVSTGTLTCSLAADTPAAGIAVGGAARFPFTKVNCSATGGDVIIDQLVVQRTGLAQDAALSSLDIIDGDSNLPVNITSKTLNSSHKATFNDDIAIANGTTKFLILAANMASKVILGSYAGEMPSLSLDSITLKDSAALNTSLPITGNVQTINSTITIGTVTVDSGAYSNATSSTIQVGKEGYTFLAFQVQAGSAEKVEFSQIKVYQQGSASLGTDIVNMELLQDANKIADGTAIDSKYATFDFDTIILDKGATAQFRLKADVAGGSARTVKLGIYKTTDLLVKGLTYGYNITPTYKEGGVTAGSGTPVFNDAEFTISNGTLNVTRSTSVGSENIAVASDQILGAFEFEVKGEPINIAALTLTVTSTTGGDMDAAGAVTGVELIDPDGNVVAGPTDPTNPGSVVWTDTFTAPVGKTIYKVRGDLSVSSGWASNDTIYVGFTPSAMTATGDTTGNTIGATPGSAVNGNTQTVKAASLTVTRRSTPGNSTIVVGKKDLVLSAWDFDASASGEDVRVTSIGFTVPAKSATTMNAATNTNALTIYVDGVAQSPVNDAIAVNTSAVSSTFALDPPIIITKGTIAKIELKGDKSSVASNDTEQWGIQGNSITVTAVGTGQAVAETITNDAGPLFTNRAMGMMTIDVDSKPSSAIILAGPTGTLESTFVGVAFTALYEDARLDKLIVNLGDGGYEFSSTSNYVDINEVCLYHGGDYLTGSSAGSCKNIPSGGTRIFEFDTDVLTIAANRSEVITIKAIMPIIGSSIDGSSPYSSSDLKLGFGGTDGIKFTGMSSNTEITGAGNEIYSDSTSSYQVLYKSRPIVTIASGDDALGAAAELGSGGNKVIFAYKVAADASGGDVLLYRTTFFITTSSDATTIVTLQNCYMKYSGDGYAAKILANSALTDLEDGVGGAWLTATFNNPGSSVYSGADDEVIKITSGSSETFRLYCNVGGVDNALDGVTTFLVGDTASTTNNVGYKNCANTTPSSGICTAGFETATADFSAASSSNFLWSDNWLNRSISGAGPTSATSSPMWYNGYLVSGLEKSVTTTSYTVNK